MSIFYCVILSQLNGISYNKILIYVVPRPKILIRLAFCGQIERSQRDYLRPLGAISSFWPKTTTSERSQRGYSRPTAADTVRCGIRPQYCSKSQCQDNLATCSIGQQCPVVGGVCACVRTCDWELRSNLKSQASAHKHKLN